ncbi:MAG TPA: rhodanese-like domain-containing protein [bacterium]|nr:rhodanese-like domain-containing protein [bacterium]
MEYFWIALGALIIAWIVYRKLQMRKLDLTPAELSDRLNKVPRPVLLDVRSRSEYTSDHIKNAKNIPAREIRHKLGQLEKNKRNEIVVYCQNGSRSAAIARFLHRYGLNVKHLEGGLVAYRRVES